MESVLRYKDGGKEPPPSLQQPFGIKVQEIKVEVWYSFLKFIGEQELRVWHLSRNLSSLELPYRYSMAEEDRDD